MLKRDPKDRRYPERLTGSYFMSLGMHLIAAALFFTVATTSSEEGATQSVSGGEVVTLERQAPVVAQVQPAAPEPAAPVPVVHRIAPTLHHPIAAQAARQPNIPHKRELSQFKKKAPPQPLPIPQSTQAPAPQPTDAVFEPNPQNDIAAAPITVPTIAPITVAVKERPTVAPSPIPSAKATTQPSPRPVPSAVASVRPATPAPAAPKAAPTAIAVAVAVKATSAPTSSAAPASQASSAPALKQGVPSPSPTQGSQVASTKGVAPSPGPKGESSPGPRAGNSGLTKAGPQRPITVPTTPSPEPATVARSSGNGGNSAVNKARSILQSLMGTAVTPNTKTYDTGATIKGRLEPTPPPEVVAVTKFIYTTHQSLLSAERVKMWVSSVRGGRCYGWQIRYPEQGAASNSLPNSNGGPPSNGAHFGGGPSPISPFQSGEAPIVDGQTSVLCSSRDLTPFTAP